MNRKLLIILSLVAAAAAGLGTAHGADRHAELVGIGAASPKVGPSTIVRTEVVGTPSVSERIAAEWGILTLETRVVENYRFTANPVRGDTGGRYDDMVGVGAASPVTSLIAVPVSHRRVGGVVAKN